MWAFEGVGLLPFGLLTSSFLIDAMLRSWWGWEKNEKDAPDTHYIMCEGGAIANQRGLHVVVNTTTRLYQLGNFA